MKPYQRGTHTLPPSLVRLNIHVKRSQAPRLVGLAERIARIKSRGVRLGEALELVLAYAARVSDTDLLKDLTPDHHCPDWLMLAPIQREPGPIVPRLLRSVQTQPHQG